MAENNMEILLKQEARQETDKIIALLKSMSVTEQSKMLIFMQGVKFAENLKTK